MKSIVFPHIIVIYDVMFVTSGLLTQLQ